MKIPKEIRNAIFIFLGIAVFFLLMEVLNLAHLFYLRLLNVLFILYGVHRTLKMNRSEGKNGFVSNAISAMVTSLTAVIMSIIALLIYIHARGGEAYVKTLSSTFMFGGEPSVTTYGMSLLFEGTASCIIVTLVLMLCSNDKYQAD